MSKTDFLPAGKLPLEVLSGLLGKIPGGDPRVVLGGRTGEDAAVIDLGDRYLIAASDPVTFATERPGWYAVQVNANDIAAMGGECRWLLATLLLPENRTTADEVESLFTELSAACSKLGVALVGGHTEITSGMERPLICGTMLGEAAPERLCLKRNARAGDILLLAGELAIEGTALIAREFPDRLRDSCTTEEIAAGASLLDEPGISVVAAARAALDAGGVHAMHDPTEGGLAGAVFELCEAAGLGMELELDHVPVHGLTEKFCGLMGLDPLGLISSGSLLIACEPEAASGVITSVTAAGIKCTAIGALVPREAGLTEFENGHRRELRRFGRDELVKLFG